MTNYSFRLDVLGLFMIFGFTFVYVCLGLDRYYILFSE